MSQWSWWHNHSLTQERFLLAHKSHNRVRIPDYCVQTQRSRGCPLASAHKHTHTKNARKVCLCVHLNKNVIQSNQLYVQRTSSLLAAVCLPVCLPAYTSAELRNAKANHITNPIKKRLGLSPWGTMLSELIAGALSSKIKRWQKDDPEQMAIIQAERSLLLTSIYCTVHANVCHSERDSVLLSSCFRVTVFFSCIYFFLFSLSPLRPLRFWANTLLVNCR